MVGKGPEGHHGPHEGVPSGANALGSSPRTRYLAPRLRRRGVHQVGGIHARYRERPVVGRGDDRSDQVLAEARGERIRAEKLSDRTE